MGVDYYLVSDEAKEKYALGRNYWPMDFLHLGPEELKEHAENLAIDFGADKGDARRFARELAQWAEERGGEVRIVTDAEEEYDEKIRDYKETGNVFDRKIMSKEDIEQRIKEAAEKLREELGGDRAKITYLIETTPMIDEPDERWFTEYTAISAYDEEYSGWKTIREKQPAKESEEY